MTRLALFSFIFLFCLSSSAQEIQGQWNGLLKVQGLQLRVVFHISKTDNGLSTTMDSPDQGAKGIPTTTTMFEAGTLKITVANAGIVYEGTLQGDTLVNGNFSQRGQSFPMNLSRREVVMEKMVRPQEPAKPYPYYSEDVTFINTVDQITLAGTLTLPKKEGVFPAVILISGSGPQNRDEELMGHKPFLILSDYLTRKGIAVLRYDDRGTASSKGVFASATSADFARDVEAAVKFLLSRKEINKSKIGLVGHSEGGIIAPMVASTSKDIAFVVLMAGTGIRGDKLLLLQQELIGRASGASEADLATTQEVSKGAYDIIIKSNGPLTLESELTNYFEQHLKKLPATQKPAGIDDAQLAKTQVGTLLRPWMQYFIKHDPTLALEKVKCPVLAVNGSKDLQVPPKENLSAIEGALKKGGNNQVTIKEFKELNHLFQECITGSPAEYSTIEQTISPIALIEIATWIQIQAAAPKK